MADSPKPELPEQMKWPDHPVICTFAATLPFPLGLTEAGVHTYQLTTPFQDPASNALFPDGPFVRIRIHNAMLGGLQFEPVTTQSALKALYGKDINAVAGLIPGEAYEQWVSLETPSPRLMGENPDDAGYHFHRCLMVLDMFLRAHNLAFRNLQVYPTATEEMGYVIFIGQYELTGEWSFFNSMLNRPERLRDYRKHQADPDREGAALAWAFGALTAGHPFVTAVGFALRAQRFHHIHGNQVDFVISLQTAMESRLFSTWRMLLVDLGKRASEISDTVTADAPFKTLIVTIMPSLIGGAWNITAKAGPVSAYWKDLYLLRNRVVHAGYEPSPREAEASQKAYDALRYFVRERLWARRREFPRTALVVIGQDGMAARGWRDKWLDKRAEEFQREPRAFYLPWDIAGRPNPRR